MITAKIIQDARDLERLAPAWLDLLHRSAMDEPVLEPAWVLSWWRIFGDSSTRSRGASGSNGRRLRCFAFYRGPTLVGLAPLLSRRHWYKPCIPLQRLELLCSGEDAADEICSEYLNVIAERGAEQAVAFSLVEALAGEKLGAWDELVIPRMNGASEMPTHIAAAFRALGFSAEMAESSLAYYIPLPTTWGDYLAQLSSSDRYLVNRSLRDFEKWAGPLVLETAKTRDEFERGKRILVSLHGERWASRATDGVFGSPRFRAFHDAVMPELFDRGELEIAWVCAKGEPIAALYNIVHEGKVHFYQSGRKIDVPKGIRPGIVVHAAAIRRSIELGRREYDFLGGGSQYKKQLALATRPLIDLRAARPTIWERARAITSDGLALARRARGMDNPSWPLSWISNRLGGL